MTIVTFTTQILLCIFNPIPIQLGHARTKGGLMMIFIDLRKKPLTTLQDKGSLFSQYFTCRVHKTFPSCSSPLSQLYHQVIYLNPLPNDKFLDMTKMKVFADDKLNVDKMTISLCDRV